MIRRGEFRRKSRECCSLLALSLVLCAAVAPLPTAKAFGRADASGAAPTTSATLTVEAAGFVPFGTVDPASEQLPVEISGPDEALAALRGGQAQPLAAVAADVDGDGASDVVVGYNIAGSGYLGVFFGNPASVVRSSGSASASSILRDRAPIREDAVLVATDVRPDILVSQDFDRDGVADVAVAARGGATLDVLFGKHSGDSLARVSRDLSGPITALAAVPGNTADAGVLCAATGGLDSARITFVSGRARSLDVLGEAPLGGAPATSLAVVRQGLSATLLIGTESGVLLGLAPEFALGRGEITGFSQLQGLPGVRSIAPLGDSAHRAGLVATDGTVLVATLDGASLGVDETRAAESTDARLLPLRDGRVAVIDGASGTIRMPTSGGSAKVESVVALAQTNVVAVASRLNGDAYDDIAYVSAERPVPSVLVSKARSTFVVTTGADSGAGSLRDAILQANAAMGLDEITFAIPGPSIAIALTSPLPVITDSVTIDATTQPGYDGTPVVELNGSGAGSPANGLEISASACTVRGLGIEQFAGDGIRIDGGDTNLVEGCFIGLAVNGVTDLGNAGFGITITGSSGNQIGGFADTSRNVISANKAGGIFIEQSGPTGNTVFGNLIGTNAVGSAPVGNTGAGILLGTAGAGNTIGSISAGGSNLISGNSLQGVSCASADASTNVVQGNLIGTNADDSDAIPNTADGLSVEGSDNLISENRIAFNLGDGIVVGPTGTGNTITANRISDNAQLGIDLLPAGVTPNDATDADSGPNSLQNFPVLTAAQSVGTSTMIQGTLESTPNSAFRIEFFTNTECDPTGFGEGEDYLGFVVVTTSAAGTANINAVLSTQAPANAMLTATAINAAGDTSEFGACIAIQTTADVAITKSASPDPVPVGADLTYTLQVTNAGPLAAEDVQLFDATPSGTTFVSLTATQGTLTTPPVGGSGSVIVDIGQILAGSVVTVVFRVHVVGPAGLTLTNTAFVTTSTAESNTDNNTVTISTEAIEPPMITEIRKGGGPDRPFKIRIFGTNFAPGIQVYIGQDTVPWPTVTYKNSGKLVVKKGASLKARFPKNVPVQIRVVNPDGGQDTAVFTR